MTLSKPLCVDLDGTLIHSDLLLESALALLKKNPLYLLLMPLWLLRGKAHLKNEIARRVQIDGAWLPYNTPFVAWLREQAGAGRDLWLCTASDRRLADRVATHVGLFKGVMASDGAVNLAGSSKAKALVDAFGERGFDYCGNHPVDLNIWRHANAAVVVNAGPSLEAQARSHTQVAAVFPSEGTPRWKAILKALRVHQWAKNVLIFLPMAAAHKLGDGPALVHALLAFVAFGFCASSVYLINDLVDLESDRQHPRKSRRPFASGALPVSFGLAAAPLLFLVSGLIATQITPKFLLVLTAYLVITSAYSFYLKKVPIIDVIALAGLYTIRLVAGAAAVGVPLSFWMLLFSTFLFLSLAIVKRNAELIVMRERGQTKASGRGYQVEDLPVLQSLGSASGYLSVLVLALYINSPEIASLYSQPKFIWFLCPLILFWISRVWIMTHRGLMHDDPVVFALKDPTSLVTVALCAVAVVLAI